MINLKKFSPRSLIPLVLLSISSSAVSAEPLVALCNNCSDSTMANQAIKSAPNGGLVHVIDMTSNNIKAFEVERERNLLWYNEGAISNTIKAGVKEIKEVNDFIKNMANQQIHINSLNPYMPKAVNSAYDIAKYKVNRLNLADAINQYFLSNIAGGLTAAVSSLGVSFVGQVVPVTIILPVIFDDGTKYSFSFKGLVVSLDGTVTLNIEAVEYSGTDGSLRIPEAGLFQGYYGKGSNDSIQRMLDYLALNGISIVVNPNYRGSVTIIDCSYDSSSGGACKATK